MKFRLSDNIAWAVEFSAETSPEFAKKFPGMLRKCSDRLVSLHRWGAAYFTDSGWFNVGNVMMGVFYEGRTGKNRLLDCRPGRIEIRGNGFEFLSISPERPCSEQVWALANNSKYSGLKLDEVDVRFGPEKIKKIRTALGLTQVELGQKLGVSERCIRDWEKGLKRPVAKNARAISALLKKRPG